VTDSYIRQLYKHLALCATNNVSNECQCSQNTRLSLLILTTVTQCCMASTLYSVSLPQLTTSDWGMMLLRHSSAATSLTVYWVQDGGARHCLHSTCQSTCHQC